MSDNAIRIQLRHQGGSPGASGVQPVDLVIERRLTTGGLVGRALVMAGAILLAIAALIFLVNYEAAWVTRSLTRDAVLRVQEWLVVLVAIGASLLGGGMAWWQAGFEHVGRLEGGEGLDPMEVPRA